METLKQILTNKWVLLILYTASGFFLTFGLLAVMESMWALVFLILLNASFFLFKATRKIAFYVTLVGVGFIALFAVVFSNASLMM